MVCVGCEMILKIIFLSCISVKVVGLYLYFMFLVLVYWGLFWMLEVVRVFFLCVCVCLLLGRFVWFVVNWGLCFNLLDKLSVYLCK